MNNHASVRIDFVSGTEPRSFVGRRFSANERFGRGSAFRSRRFFREPSIFRFGFLLMLLVSFVTGGVNAQGKKTPAGEEFFMVASLDQSKSQLLLKLPTEVTLLAKVTPQDSVLRRKRKTHQAFRFARR